MKVDVETVSPVEKKVSIAVPWDDVKQELDTAYRDLAKRAQVKGFRAGKVPRKVLEKFYKQSVEGQVLGQILDDSFKKAVAEKDLVPIDNPQVSDFPTLKPNEDLEFTATVQVKPEIDIKEYKGLNVEKKVRQVSDEEVDTELQQMREKATVVEPVTDRQECQADDLAVIDFFGYVDGETFKGGKGINYTVQVGANQMIEGFEDHLIGMKIGDEKKFQLNFPKGQGPDEVQGKDVDWKVDLKELKTKILPELDDDFAQDLGDYDTLDELKAGLRENIATREDARAKRQLRDAVMEKLVEENPVEVPPTMIERQLDYLLNDAMKMMQTATPEMKEAIGKLRGELRPRAQRQVAGMLLLEAVARVEDVEVEDQALEGRIQELARENRMQPKQLKIQLKQNDQIESLRYNMKQDKALDLVLEAATVTERTVTQEELDAEEAAAAAADAGAAAEASEGEPEHVHGPDCDHD